MNVCASGVYIYTYVHSEDSLAEVLCSKSVCFITIETTTQESYIADISIGCSNPPQGENMTTGATENSLHVYNLHKPHQTFLVVHVHPFHIQRQKS